MKKITFKYFLEKEEIKREEFLELLNSGKYICKTEEDKVTLILKND